VRVRQVRPSSRGDGRGGNHSNSTSSHSCHVLLCRGRALDAQRARLPLDVFTKLERCALTTVGRSLGTSAHPLHSGTAPRASAAAALLLAELHPRAPSWDPLAEKRGTTSAPFASRGATRATAVATDATREQPEEQSAVDGGGGGSPSALPTVGSSDAGAPSAAVSNRAVELTAVDGSVLHHHLHALVASTPHQPAHQPSHHHSPTSAVTGSPLPTHNAAGCTRALT